MVAVQLVEAELPEVWRELDARVVGHRLAGLLDFGRPLLAHVVAKHLRVALAQLGVDRVDDEARREDVRELGAQAVAATDSALLRVVEVLSREEVTVAEFRTNTFSFLCISIGRPLPLFHTRIVPFSASMSTLRSSSHHHAACYRRHSRGSLRAGGRVARGERCRRRVWRGLKSHRRRS